MPPYFWISLIHFLFGGAFGTEQNADSKMSEYDDFKRFKLEILETQTFSVTFRFENVELQRTKDFYFSYCVQVG